MEEDLKQWFSEFKASLGKQNRTVRQSISALYSHSGPVSELGPIIKSDCSLQEPHSEKTGWLQSACLYESCKVLEQRWNGFETAQSQQHKGRGDVICVQHLSSIGVWAPGPTCLHAGFTYIFFFCTETEVWYPRPLLRRCHRFTDTIKSLHSIWFYSGLLLSFSFSLYFHVHGLDFQMHILCKMDHLFSYESK